MEHDKIPSFYINSTRVSCGPYDVVFELFQKLPETDGTEEPVTGVKMKKLPNLL